MIGPLLALAFSCLVFADPAIFPLPSQLVTGSQETCGDFFSAHTIDAPTDKIESMLDTYLQRLKNQTFYADITPSGTVSSISTTVTSSETVPIDVDESYELDVDGSKISVTAATVFGAFHAYETLIQLIEFDEDEEEYMIWQYYVGDEPRFPWRGLLIDTARHWLPTRAIKRQIKALAAAKMNVLHWHVCDAESFPWRLNSEPLLSEGAYSEYYTYTSDEIAEVVEFGVSWGVYVVLELDMPGHTYSWGAGYPNIIASCPSYEHNINNIPLDPSNDQTYDVVSNVVFEALELTGGRYIHLGGDEVVTSCWKEDDDIVEFMSDHGLSTSGLWNYFTNRVSSSIPPDAAPIYWHETFDNDGTYHDNTMFEAWSDQYELGAIVKAGYPGILAGGFYLDQQEPTSTSHYAFYSTWEDFFNNEPTSGLNLSDQQEELIRGGEAVMFGEGIDESSMDTFIWPRALGTAERLWINKHITDVDAAEERIQSQRCFLARRGVGAGPIGPNEPCPGEYIHWSWDPIN
eukprot:gnl/Chilomastix_cuspidata/425.p1 GENE.gnl/Chilomastix_cuspidata/425~~gnl/Chilomastix_cuspidata/425.p1  ORF type:complete len:517 (+),score=141.80 gnl/Chilomastix_cuspidata/425:51-1601(+)